MSTPRMSSRSPVVAALAAAGIIVSISPGVAAQDPSGLSSQAPASSGSTSVAQEGFQKVVVKPEDDKDGTTFKVGAGGLLSQGNARTLAATVAGDYFMRRGSNQFSALAAVNYGRAAADADSDMEVNVENYQARVRYDRFVSGQLAAFLSTSARRDRFQGLNLRLNIDPGFAYYFVDEKSHRLWAELGYDFQLDLRRQEVIDAAAADPDAPEVGESEVRHNTRVFVGYDNQLTDAVKVNLGLEYLQNLGASKNARINADAGLTSQLSETFSTSVTVSMRFDNNPLPGVEKTDVLSALNLVYSLTQ